MIIRKKKRKVPGLNTASTADISFMLLIFFLVTTSMDVDKGLFRLLPSPEPQKLERQETHVDRSALMALHVTADQQLLLNDKPIPVASLKDRTVAFINRLGEGKLGKIFEIDTQMSTCHSKEYREWLQSFACGTMYIFGCHLLDMIFQVLGPDYQKLTPYLRRTKPEEVDLLDNALAVVEYPDATCTVRTTSVEVNGFGRRQLVICGTEGTVEVKPLEGPPTISVSMKKDHPATYQDEKQFITVPPMTGRYDIMVQDFAAYIRGEKQNPFTHDYEIALQKATLQACGLPTE